MTKRLTWEQKAIVNHETGHALVKAVPGSGKTTTLVKRIERLVKTGTAPQSILILMYNKSAQISFSEKLKIALQSDEIPEVRTFHSLALKIVKYGEKQRIIRNKKLIPPSNHLYQNLVKQAYTNTLDSEDFFVDSTEIEEFELFIARCRASAVTPTDVASDPTFSKIKREFIHGYREYCQLLEDNCLRTFDDCLIDSISILRRAPSLGAHIKHIIVDEYQDVNLVQHDMIRLLACASTSVMAVGDINQCIYEWRGARPDFIGGLFERHYRGTKVFQLSCTFRFGHELSLIANSVIRRNSTKLSKLCVSHPSTPKTTVNIHIDSCLSKLLPDLTKYSGTQAIIARNKATLAEAEVILRICGIPCRYLNESHMPLVRTEIAMIIVCVLLSVYGDLELLKGHPKEKTILYGFLRESGFKWKKGKFKIVLNDLTSTSNNIWTVLETSINDSSDQKKRLSRLASIRGKYMEDTPTTDILQRLNQLGFIAQIGSAEVTRISANDQRRGIVKIADLLESNKIECIRFINLILSEDSITADQSPVILSTLHGSKGLEWDSVVLVGLSENEFPGGVPDETLGSDRSKNTLLTNEDIEEERRLFYVGITRSKKLLNLIVPFDERLQKWIDNKWDSTPKKVPIASRFVYECGWSLCSTTSDLIYKRSITQPDNDINRFHQWYLRDLQKLRV